MGQDRGSVSRARTFLMLEPGCGQQSRDQEDEQVDEGEQVVAEDDGCRRAGVHGCCISHRHYYYAYSSIYIAWIPGAYPLGLSVMITIASYKQTAAKQTVLFFAAK